MNLFTVIHSCFERVCFSWNASFYTLGKGRELQDPRFVLALKSFLMNLPRYTLFYCFCRTLPTLYTPPSTTFAIQPTDICEVNHSFEVIYFDSTFCCLLILFNFIYVILMFLAYKSLVTNNVTLFWTT